MRITSDIDEDVWLATKEIAKWPSRNLCMSIMTSPIDGTLAQVADPGSPVLNVLH